MIKAIAQELAYRNLEARKELITSIYWGGGSPSLLQEAELSEILNALHQNYSFSNTVEHTMELNPDDVSEAKVQMWKRLGINRFSLGVQSFDDAELKLMNRAHCADQAHKAIQIIQNAGIENLSADLIFALPNQSKSSWEKNLATIAQYNIPHLSCYNLTVEEKTVLANWQKNNKVVLHNEMSSADLFILTINYLKGLGYEQYEISNYAKDGSYSQHNSNYWNNSTYIGVGPSAHSYLNGKRRWNVSHNTQYIHKIQQGKCYWEEEVLSNKDLFNEIILTQLRTSKGINWESLQHKFPAYTLKIQEELHKLQEQKLITWDKNIQLTLNGKLIADELSSSLFMLD